MHWINNKIILFYIILFSAYLKIENSFFFCFFLTHIHIKGITHKFLIFYFIPICSVAMSKKCKEKKNESEIILLNNHGPAESFCLLIVSMLSLEFCAFFFYYCVCYCGFFVRFFFVLLSYLFNVYLIHCWFFFLFDKYLEHTYRIEYRVLSFYNVHYNMEPY